MESRERLVHFLNDVKDFLDKLITTGKDYQDRPLVVAELHPGLNAAWQDVKPRFAVVESAIRELQPAPIADKGLSGAQLNLKTRLVKKFWDSFSGLGGRKFLKKLLDAIDNLLGSIIKATGVGEGIEELKHALELAVDED